MAEVNILAVKDYVDATLNFTLENHPIGVRPLVGGFLGVGVIVSSGFSGEVKEWMRKDSLRRRIAAVVCPMLLSMPGGEAHSPEKPTLFGRSFFGEVKKIQGILTSP